MIPIIVTYLLVLVAHLSLVLFKILPGDFNVLAGIDGILALLFVGGILIAFPGIKKGGESFVQRFLIITTVQLLMMMGLILILTFSKISHTRALGFNAITVFVILLFIQSIYLIKKINAK